LASAPSIAIVGMACVYPDARTPAELWENVLAQRRSFRRLPPERLRREDYWSADRSAPDRTYAFEGAVIEGYEFDRVGFRVVGSTFRSADLAHWLALDVAARALVDAGFPEGRGLPRESTGVLVGNTLTGEFARANNLRLRWPYVRRVVEAALAKEGWSPETRGGFLERLESEYKSPFPPVGEESLAGGLSNTIAGRICNQFDLKGGGYTVDGACASSLLAVANACAGLATGDLDVALAGGVDLSLDPFELVGFAKTGAFAAEEMRVFDQRSAGFWPGEGCGFVTLMRHEDALARGCRVYAVIRGWGISSDGSGGVTRPEAQGQIEALRRAYRRAGFGIDTVVYCEGHGTGTAVGDATELEVLSRARRQAKPDAPPAAIGSIKANIGHTKAASGIAGLIKATMAVHTQVLPPTTGCEEPHQHLRGPAPALRILREAELWPKDRPLRASASAMGFGGINAHVVIEGLAAERRHTLSSRERSLSLSGQDAELFLLAGNNLGELAAQLDLLLARAAALSQAELTDLAAQLQRTLEAGQVRAAVVASWPAELAERLRALKARLSAPIPPRCQCSDGLFLGSGAVPPRIAFLFPGQGSPARLDGGIWQRRFEPVRQLYARGELPAEGDCVSTRVMQPAVVTASLAGLKVLDELGIEAHAAIGHSLGEITALCWAGVLSEEALLRIARVRGAAMADLGSPTGAMLAIAAPSHQVQALLSADPLVIVGYNSPRQTVVAGDAGAIRCLAERAEAQGWQTTRLPVSHAFHTPLVAAAVPLLAEQLACENFARLERTVISTITGATLNDQEDLRALLCRQVTSPVRFTSAFAALLGGALPTRDTVGQPGPAAGKVDLLIEVGPGKALGGLVQDITEVPVVSLDAGGSSLRGLLQAVGAAFALGASVRPEALFADRFSRPLSLDAKPKFFGNPCELAPISAEGKVPRAELRQTLSPLATAQGTGVHKPPAGNAQEPAADSSFPALELVRQLVAERAELPTATVLDHHRMLSDLHLNSITVGQLVSEAARHLGLPRVLGLTDFANASVAEMARALEELKQAGGGPRTEDRRREPPGVDIWTETFTVDLVEAPRPAPRGRLVANYESPVTHPQPPRTSPASWQVFAPTDHAFASALQKKLAAAGAGGVLLCLPEHPGEQHVQLVLEAARAVIAPGGTAVFVLVQHGWGAGGFARTLHLETPGLTTCVVNVPPACPGAVDWIAAEAASATGYTEAHYDQAGRRREPRLNLAQNPAAGGVAGAYPIGRADVLLVTGGGKGIAAESALALARATSTSLALMGRSDPRSDRELAENLERIAAAGVRCVYVRADVTDARAVQGAVAEAEHQLGPVTALLHGAGANTPQLISALDEEAIQRTLAPKIQGLRNVLAALDADRLRLLVTFGSIIARAGLRGEADYALANEWLTALTEEFQARHPGCRCLALEWSVWSGVGMGERLGRVDSLILQGIMPIHPDEGVRILLERLRHPQPATALVIAGRFGEPPTLKLNQPELPLHRFLERRRAYYPGVELVVDAELSRQTDPYLDDHLVHKERLLPAALGLEGMAQIAMALTGSRTPPSFEHVELTRPIAVSERGTTTLRLAALRRGPGLVEVCLRSEVTDYHVDHFRALCRFEPAAAQAVSARGHFPPEVLRLPLEPERDLYGRILFHRGRFRRLQGYRVLRAKECVAEIGPDDATPWFGPYLPSEFMLGNPAVRDAALHAIQACIPHRRLLPTGIDRLVIHRVESGPRVAWARERRREGNNFIYDVQVTNPGGELLEQWDGLRLRAVEELAPAESWPPVLLGPYLERRLEELVPGSSVAVAVERRASQARSASSQAALRQALGRTERLFRRPDGKPVTVKHKSLSAAHARNVTLAVAGAGVVACDVEEVAARADKVWNGLLGRDRFRMAERISRERSEACNTAATRLWNALECMKKAGLSAEAPLVLDSTASDGWVLFRSGALTIATCVVALQGTAVPLAIGLAVNQDVKGAQASPAVQTVATGPG
jgi:enediyne polyketide synthase